MNDPINRVDPSGLYAGIDDVIFSAGGALIGVAGQGISDIVSGELSGWEDYIGSAVGGAVTGEALLYTGPVGAGLAGGAAANATRQGLKMLSGKQDCFDLISFAEETGISGLTGLIPGLKIKGLTSGSGNANSIYKSMVKKLANKSVNNISTTTAAKMFTGRATDKALAQGALSVGTYYGIKNRILR